MLSLREERWNVTTNSNLQRDNDKCSNLLRRKYEVTAKNVAEIYDIFYKLYGVVRDKSLHFAMSSTNCPFTLKTNSELLKVLLHETPF